MLRRRAMRPRVVVALAAAGVLAASVVFSSAGTLGGLQTDGLGAASGVTQHVSAVQLEWNRDAQDMATRPSSLRLTVDSDQSFEQGDTVAVTATGPGSDTCSAKATVPTPSTVVDLTFPACGVMLWELRGVAVNISGSGDATALRTNVGALQGTLASFDGAVVQPDAPATPGYTTVRTSGVDRLTTLRLGVGDITADQLVGRRLVAILATPANEDTPYVGVVGTPFNNQGIWAEKDARTAVSTVVVDLTRVAGGRAPKVADVARYQLMLLQPQRLGADQSAATTYAIIPGGGLVEATAPEPSPTPTPTPTPGPSPTPQPVAVSSAVEPVGLDPRLKVTGRSSQKQDETTLRFCHEFDISNTSKEAVAWRLTFDTTKPPMWGLDPTVVDGNGIGTLQSMWGFEKIDYQRSTGLWSVGGVNYNKVLAAGQSVTVGYCAQPKIPAVDSTRFDKPQVSLEPGSTQYHVQLRMKVTSSFTYLVPWEAEIDLANYVCPASLPANLSGQNAVLTRIDGTRYRVRGTDNTFRFVSKDKKQDYVFLGFNPVSDPFAPGCS
ncbi:hypothetical protein [Tessaracoccus antarcticus]|nr:hypothetical protein [Tessaracoccus antarcticus]